MAFTFAPVTHKFMLPDGSPASGKLIFTLDHTMTNGGETILKGDMEVELDPDGALFQGFQLASTEDSGTRPSTPTWSVSSDDLDVKGTFAVPGTGGNPIDLYALLPAPA